MFALTPIENRELSLAGAIGGVAQNFQIFLRKNVLLGDDFQRRDKGRACNIAISAKFGAGGGCWKLGTGSHFFHVFIDKWG